MRFTTPTKAFEFLYNYILESGKDKSSTKYIKNVGFTIENPLDRIIKTDWRNFNEDYAEYEWSWYEEGNPDAREIAKRAKIWATCMDEWGRVNSNYGYQWNRGDLSQIDYVYHELNNNPLSRRATISIYDGKENHLYERDTPCTLSISFSIEENKLDMAVHMRSNDLVFGFCNDQYCFSKLQQMMSHRLNIEVGEYHHTVVDMHIYERHFDMKTKHNKLK